MVLILSNTALLLLVSSNTAMTSDTISDTVKVLNVRKGNNSAISVKEHSKKVFIATMRRHDFTCSSMPKPYS